MTEAEAQTWLRTSLDVSRETLDRLSGFVDLLKRESSDQNLISRATLDHIWLRHIVDSAQLLRFAPADAANWLDLGTGAGFPGLVVSALHPARVTCVESRRLRVEYLHRAAVTLGVEHKTELVCDKVERLADRAYDVISARAFAPLDRLLALAERFGSSKTRWILPKGRNARTELDAALAAWQGEIELAPSLTDPDAHIIVARDVRRRGKGRR